MSAGAQMRALAALLLLGLALVALAAGSASAAPLADNGDAEWQVEQPPPPPPGEAGVEPSPTPVSLGHIGDIEFWEPSRGALITSGNGGSVKPGVWFYDGVRWRELSTQCGATDGRIAWAGPDEFWTVSDGRPGQAVASSTERPSLADNTLCHFAPGPSGSIEIVASYASPAFLGSSYQAMHAAACLTPQDCWFGGEPLPAPQVGAFMLHWNGVSLEPVPYLPEARTVWDMRPFEGRLFESMRLQIGDRGVKLQRPPALREILPTTSPEESPFESVNELPLYSQAEFSFALDYLRLSSAGESLWAAAGPQLPTPSGSREAGVTIIRKTGEGAWSRVIGPQESEGTPAEELETPPPGAKLFPDCLESAHICSQVLDSIAAEPGTESAWVALDTESDVNAPNALARASLARVSSEGTVSDRLALPLVEDPHGPLGAAQRVVCPGEHDCWAVTGDGWLLHLATSSEREQPGVLSDPVFAKIQAEEPITFRPHDEGLPQEVSDELLEGNPGENELSRNESVIKPPVREPAKVPVPLLTHIRVKVIHRTTLVLSFHLAVKARVGLLAERKKKVVARAPQRTLKAGNRSLQLKLNAKRWPTHLHLQTHALAPLPTQSTAAPTVNSVSTSFVAPARLLSSGQIF
jgi:hypothetical protein